MKLLGEMPSKECVATCVRHVLLRKAVAWAFAKRWWQRRWCREPRLPIRPARTA